MKTSRPVLSSLCWCLLAAAELASGRRPPRPRPTDEGECPLIHVFGARETTAPPGFGTAHVLTDLVLKTFPRATSEAIDYPAAPGDKYASSVKAGIAAVVAQTSAFSARCPDSIIIMHGYSQGGQIMDDAFCGGPDGSSLNSTGTLVEDAVARQVAAIILMGDPRHVRGLSFNVGNATEGGFAARPLGFKCPQFEDRIQSYCDSPDPFCAKGDSPEHHQGYGKEYGLDALAFIVSKMLVG